MANFSITPSVNIQRTKFNRVSSHKTSMFLGDIVPIYIDEVLPGDTRTIDYASLVRMSTPIAPIMDDISFEFFAFFVPNRLTWEHWKEFCGENSTGAGANTSERTIPTVNVSLNQIGSRSLGNYLGLPYSASTTAVAVSELPLRGYYLIKNRWFRNQNLEAPIPVDIGDNANSNLSYSDQPEVASKKADYFTKSQPYAQKSAQPVMLPLGTSAPIVQASNGLPGSISVSAYRTGSLASQGSGSIDGFSGPGASNISLSFPGGPVSLGFNSENAIVDLSAATAATINQLREAFAVQRMFEKDSLYGTRYWEILYGHFGVRSPDATLQDPELLGSAKMPININQVLQTTGYSDDSGSMLGALGANSVSGNKGTLFSKSFVEHGFIYIMAVARHKNTYSQGINRMFTRKQRFDYYWPTFARLGAQAVLNKEIYAGTSFDDEVFGYQEAWAEYRYKPSITTGLLNPAQPNSMPFWVLTEKFDELPTLTTSFSKVNRNSLARALVSAETGPDFICDFWFSDSAVRPMPLNSIPGLTEYL